MILTTIVKIYDIRSIVLNVDDFLPNIYNFIDIYRKINETNWKLKMSINNFKIGIWKNKNVLKRPLIFSWDSSMYDPAFLDLYVQAHASNNVATLFSTFFFLFFYPCQSRSAIDTALPHICWYLPPEFNNSWKLIIYLYFQRVYHLN